MARFTEATECGVLLLEDESDLEGLEAALEVAIEKGQMKEERFAVHALNQMR